MSGRTRACRCLVALTLPHLVSTAAASVAGADEPVLHHVTYTVIAEQPVRANIYFRDTDPPDWAEYSHDPYQFSPKVEADVGPGARWTHEVILADPEQWAMVSVTGGPSAATAGFHCELSVDGAVVASNDGAKGALCSMRYW